MNSLNKYLKLIEERPDFFINTGEVGEIKIIKDAERIRREQKKLRAELHNHGKPEEWIDIGVLAEDQSEGIGRRNWHKSISLDFVK